MKLRGYEIKAAIRKINMMDQEMSEQTAISDEIAGEVLSDFVHVVRCWSRFAANKCSLKKFMGTKFEKKSKGSKVEMLDNSETYHLFRSIYVMIFLPRHWAPYVLDDIEKKFHALIKKSPHLKGMWEPEKLKKYIHYLRDNYIGDSGGLVAVKYDRWNLYGKENFRHLQQQMETNFKVSRSKVQLKKLLIILILNLMIFNYSN